MEQQKHKNSGKESGYTQILTRLTAANRHRNWKWISAGVLAICVGILSGVSIYVKTTDAVSVIKVVRDLSAGEHIGISDLTVVTIPKIDGVAVVNAGQMQNLVNKIALTDLKRDSLLAPNSIGDNHIPEGKVQLGLKLPLGKIPMNLGSLGSKITIINASGNNAASVGAKDNKSAAVLEHKIAFPATVATVSKELADGTIAVDIWVSEDDISDIAKLVSDNNVIIVQEAA